MATTFAPDIPSISGPHKNKEAVWYESETPASLRSPPRVLPTEGGATAPPIGTLYIHINTEVHQRQIWVYCQTGWVAIPFASPNQCQRFAHSDPRHSDLFFKFHNDKPNWVKDDTLSKEDAAKKRGK